MARHAKTLLGELVDLADDVLQTHSQTGPVFENTPTLDLARFAEWQARSLSLLSEAFGPDGFTALFREQVRRAHIYDVQRGRGILLAAHNSLPVTDDPMRADSASSPIRDSDTLTALKALYSRHDSLASQEEGRRWLAQVAAIIQQFDPGTANEIRQRAEMLTLSLSTHTIGPVWKQILQLIDNAIATLEATPAVDRARPAAVGNRVFIGHGRSSEWIKLRDLLRDRLHLDFDEFNRESAVGYATTQRLEEMLDSAGFAFVVLTAEDEHADGSTHARENVVHELGLFQGRLGFRRAIVMLEEGCAEFSNIAGLTQIRFPKGNILAQSEEVRRVLERERLLTSDSRALPKMI